MPRERGRGRERTGLDESFCSIRVIAEGGVGSRVQSDLFLLRPPYSQLCSLILSGLNVRCLGGLSYQVIERWLLDEGLEFCPQGKIVLTVRLDPNTSSADVIHETRQFMVINYSVLLGGRGVGGYVALK